MRSADDILELVTRIARDDPRVHAVLLNGSRANPNATRDILQDFDIVYLVDEIESFRQTPTWIACFGEPLIVQIPEDMEDPPPSRDGRYAYLMLFTDGNRIDLTLCPIHLFDAEPIDSLTVILLDKDGRLPALPPASEADYVVPAPTAKQFADCCNEFLWVSTNVAKGLWREELVYARVMLDQYVRPQALRMLDWSIGAGSGFTINPGKLGKRYKQALPGRLWALVQASYADADLTRNWAALHALFDAFEAAATTVARALDLASPADDSAAVRAYLRRLEALPRVTPNAH